MLELYTRAEGLCQNCGVELGAAWHGSHLAAWANQGATSVDNMRAWCATCNLRLGSRDVEQVEDVTLRLWQREAFGPIMHRLWTAGSATLHAAPGAGKTLFLAAIFWRGFELGYWDRLLVVVPNLNLVDQTVNAFTRMRIHLDNSPRDGVIEHPDTVGLVVCYQSLSKKAAEAHASRMEQTPTLVAFDEVHHVAEKEHGAWGKAVVAMVGDIATGPPDNAAAVLNMTGTLFRSAKSQKISTVRYRRVAEDRWQAVADWSVKTVELVGVELRPPDLYVYGGEARLVDLENERIIEGEIVDLSRRERQVVKREMYKSKDYMRRYLAEGVRMLKNHLLAVRHEVPLKMLVACDGQREARMAADIINELTEQDFARLVISEEPGSLKTLKRASKERRPCAIVAVQMVTEGFDCPAVSTLVHATRKTAPLWVAQFMARGMRITDHERAVGRVLPTQVLIPDDPVVREAYASALNSALHEVEEETGRCHAGHRQTICPCRYPGDVCTCPFGPPPPPIPRYELLDLGDPELRGGTVLGQPDGDLEQPELSYYIEECNRVLIPETYALRVGVLARQGPPATRTYSKEEPPVAKPANPRDVVDMYRAKLRQASGWMERHIGHEARFPTVGVFQGKANDAGEIPAGGRDQATAQQLALAASWMCARIREHCEANEEQVPEFAAGGGVI